MLFYCCTGHRVDYTLLLLVWDDPIGCFVISLCIVLFSSNIYVNELRLKIKIKKTVVQYHDFVINNITFTVLYIILVIWQVIFRQKVVSKISFFNQYQYLKPFYH